MSGTDGRGYGEGRAWQKEHAFSLGAAIFLIVQLLSRRSQVWRAKYAVAKIRKAARELLTLDEKVCWWQPLPICRDYFSHVAV